MNRNRSARSFLTRQMLALLLLATVGCTGLVTPNRDTAIPVTAVPALSPGMEIGLVSTAMMGQFGRNQVNPDEPGGGMLVTVQEITTGESVTIGWRRTETRAVEPAQPTPVVGVGTPSPTPVQETVTVEGTITATGLRDAQDAYLPLYWQESGRSTTDTSLLWLSQQAFQELKTTRRTRWTPDIMTRLSLLPLIVLRQLEEEATDREIYLEAEADFVTYELLVNGERTAVQAIKAYDTFGNEYLILDNEDNPLILKFTFNVMTTGAIGIDAGVWLLIKSVYSGYQVVHIDTL
jgi:hypothetical protein